MKTMYTSDVLAMDDANLSDLNPVFQPKTFSSGKVGFHTSQPVVLKTPEGSCKFQLGGSLVAHKSEKMTDEQKQEILDIELDEVEKALKKQVGPMSPRRFSSGSCGYNANGKLNLKVGKRVQTFQVSINVVAHKSKTWDAERPVATEEDSATA